jgi:hypothetical protein
MLAHPLHLQEMKASLRLNCICTHPRSRKLGRSAGPFSKTRSREVGRSLGSLLHDQIEGGWEVGWLLSVKIEGGWRGASVVGHLGGRAPPAARCHLVRLFARREMIG